MANIIKYQTDGKNYTLCEKCGITCPGVDFGKWEAYGVGEWSKTLYISADGHDLMVHPGYNWDGCTGVPTSAWNVRASLFHDALYQTKKCGAETAQWWEIDAIFNTIMKQDGASWFQRNLYYVGVRTFGAFFKCNKLNSLTIVQK